MDRPFISICINSHNEGERLKATIDDFRANIGSWPHEIIVVADGTTDGSADNLGDDVKVIKTLNPIGCGKSKNELDETAKGDVLFCNDAHEMVLEGSIAEMCIRAFEDDVIWTPVVRDIVYSDDWKPSLKNEKYQIPNERALGYNAKQYRKETEEWCKANHGKCVNIPGVGFAISRKTLDKIGGFNGFIGRHGSQERGIGLRAFMAKVPVKLDTTLIIGHEFRTGATKFPPKYRRYSTRDQAFNLWHAYYVVAGDKAFEALKPKLGKIAKTGCAVIKNLSVKAERNAFMKLRKRTDDELLMLLKLADNPNANIEPKMPERPHFITHIPYAPQGVEIGVEYNRIMRDATTDWVLLLDHDVLLLHPNWYRVCQDAILQKPDAGMFSCYTNNIGCKRQKDKTVAGHDIAQHRAHARMRWDKHGNTLTDNRTHYIGGFFMLINKKAWEKAGGFVETGFFGVDNDFHKNLLRVGHMVYQMEGLYCYHVRDREQTTWIQGEYTSFERTKKRTKQEMNRSILPATTEAQSYNTVVYSVLTGGYDKIPQKPCVPKHWDCVLFSDRAIKAPGWNVRILDTLGFDSVRASRLPKILPHEYLYDYDYSIYIDANMTTKGNLESFLNRISWPEFAATKHRHRDCIYQEFKRCKELNKDSGSAIDTQMERYKTDGMPKQTGLTANGILARKHNCEKTKQIDLAWWAEYSNAESYRDQLSLPYVLWKNNLSIKEWSATERARFFKIGLHK